MTYLLILIPVFIVLAALVVLASARRRDTDRATGQLSRETRRRDQAKPPFEPPKTGREVEKSAAIERRPPEIEPATAGELAEYVPPDPEQLGVTRRQFLNRTIVTFMGLSLAGFGASVLAFLWPVPKGGFGSVIQVGKISDILSEISAGSGFYYFAQGRLWMTAYPASALQKAEKVYSQPVLN
ncbi:MAG TPA: hypothetical protein VMT43_08595, partial [Acidimicrobiales bacterium]|nr:hypothetical protein [Acidimicrobiales bacterium]